MSSFPELVDPLAGVWSDEDQKAEDAVVGPLRATSAGLNGKRPKEYPPAPVDPCLDSLLATGATLWRTDELLELGIGPKLLGSLCARRSLISVRRGCYVLAGHWSSLSNDDQDLLRVQAYAHRAALTTSGRYSFSHVSAARLHRLKLWKVGGQIHVNVPFLPSGNGHAADVVAHTREVSRGELVRLDGLPATSLERTVVDCCGLLNYRQSLILTDHALRRGAKADKLREYCLAMEGRPGVVNLRKVLATADARSESPGETLTRDVLRRFRTPAPVLQHEVWTRNGLARMDFAWPDRMAALEFDGKTKYFDYKPTEQAIFEERQREKALMELGWRILRIEWKDVFREQELRARLSRLLGP